MYRIQSGKYHIIHVLSFRSPHLLFFKWSLVKQLSAQLEVQRVLVTHGVLWKLMKSASVLFNTTTHACVCVCWCVLYPSTFVSVHSTKLEKPGGSTDHAKVTALKETAPRSLQGPLSQLVWLHRCSHTDDYPLGGHCAPHLSPGPAVRHGCSWSHMGDSGLCSVDKHAVLEVLMR